MNGHLWSREVWQRQGVTVRAGRDRDVVGISVRPEHDSLRTVCVKARPLYRAGRAHLVACLGPSHLCRNSTTILNACEVPGTRELSSSTLKRKLSCTNRSCKSPARHFQMAFFQINMT